MGGASTFLKRRRKEIVQSYEERLCELPGLYRQLQEKLAGVGGETALALKYLYVNMPYSDMGNYSFETYLDYAEHAVFLWEKCEEIRSLPEEIFLNYVLYHRVNEEEITPCRSFFYGKIKNCIQGLHGKEAAVEVNYWCAREASYRCTDDRTRSAMAVFQQGSGRCGEESVFAVNALRSMGIPARQVYAPKWSHCDDNHAWAEVWCGGAWHFMGACEPEPILNKGWFTGAASRAMMVHSRWFDAQRPRQSVIGKDGMVTMLNELERYAAVKRVSVQVRDAYGNPVAGAEVSFEVLNYSEYAPIARAMTDDKGEAGLMTGLGSLHIHVRKGDKFAEEVMDTRVGNTCQIILKTPEPESCWQSCDMIAPVDMPLHTALPAKEQQKASDARLAASAEKLREKTAGWKHSEREDFLYGKSDAPRLREAMLQVLTEKDQTDCRSQILEEHLEYALPYEKQFPWEIFVHYVLNPRVEDEVLSKYRKTICHTFSCKECVRMKKNPGEIWDLVKKRIQALPAGEYDGLVTTPAACLKLGIGSRRSQEILFVAIARTLGIPARKNPRDGSIEYWKEGNFISVLDGTRKNCRLLLKATGDTVWKYFQNWSIARLSEGRYSSLKLSGVEWENQKLELMLAEGRYRILTSNRLPNGNVFVNQYEFHLRPEEPKEPKEVMLEMRTADLSDMLENIALPEFYLKNADDAQCSASRLLSAGRHILLFLEEGKEPTEHILNEMLERREEFARYAESMIFVVKGPDSLQNENLARAVNGFPGVQIYYDKSGKNINMLGRKMYVDHEKLPLIIVTNNKNGIYAASGYNVGIGDMLLKILRKS